eukprot:337068-Pyramimonas_sp.AAC.1
MLSTTVLLLGAGTPAVSSPSNDERLTGCTGSGQTKSQAFASAKTPTRYKRDRFCGSPWWRVLTLDHHTA